MSGPDNMEYDSTGAGEFVRPAPIGAARPGATAEVPSGVPGGPVSGDGSVGARDATSTTPRATPPGDSEAPQIARDGGVQRIPS